MLTAGTITRGGETYRAKYDLMGDLLIYRGSAGFFATNNVLTIERDRIEAFAGVTTEAIVDIYRAGLRDGTKAGRDGVRKAIAKALES